MLTKDTLRYGLYAGVLVLILALTGMFGKFAERVVFGGTVTLAQITLVMVTLLSSLFVSGQSKSKSAVATLVNALYGALIVGGVLAVLAWLEGQVDLTFMFADLKPYPIAPQVLFGQPFESGVLSLLGLSAALGVLTFGLRQLPEKLLRVILLAVGATITIGLLEAQINKVVTISDALCLVITFTLGYAVTLRGGMDVRRQLIISAAVGVVIGIVLGLVASSGSFPATTIFGRFSGAGLVVISAVIFGMMAALGVTAANAARGVHDAIVASIGVVLLLGVLNWQDTMTWLAAVIATLIFAGLLWFSEHWGGAALQRFEAMPRPEQKTVRRYSIVVGLLVMLILPTFVGQYISSIADLVGLYVIMGIGLNVVVGYAGLLDLGYVAFFALGAYTIGTLTTPSLITCGWQLPSDLTPDQIISTCHVLTFWQAWPVAILVSGLAGVLLGIPVLRLRGDYLAIVTLGFGEIVRLITLSTKFKPLFGGAGGIGNIPSPVLDLTFLNPAWKADLGNALNIYYVILIGIAVVAFITLRLGGSRLGRAWRAMRADEDVAQAMGINLTRTKLLAFATGAAFAGMGGAIFGSWLHGIFPNSFVLAVSINVLALIIIGGLGSIPGVVLGAFMLLGLPEALRELQDYRLLAFGVLLVVTMLMKPQGLIPPPVRRLSEQAERKVA